MAENALDMEKVLHKFSLLNQINLDQPKEKFCPKDVVEQAIQSLLPSIQSKNINVQVEGGLEQLLLDKDAFYIIVFVSLENAINFTKNDSEELPKVCVKIIQDSNQLTLQVYDNGIGIRDSIRDEIFNMYFRGTELSKGNGLGLYVSRKAVEKLKGSIYVESKEDKYSQFTYAIPL
jgi:signal transduction histidine kinase